MQNLINIETKNINGELIQTVNARDLHTLSMLLNSEIKLLKIKTS